MPELADRTQVPEAPAAPGDLLLGWRASNPYWLDLDLYAQALVARAGTAAAEASVALAALAARMTAVPSADRQRAMIRLIASLIGTGVWDRLDALWLPAAHDAQAGRLNWIGDRYNLTAVNSPAWTADRGYKGDGAAAYLSTGFVGGGATDKCQQSSATVGVYVQQLAAAGTTCLAGSTDTGAPGGSAGTRVMMRYETAGPTYHMLAVNDASNSVSAAGALAALGLYTVTRNSAATSEAYLGSQLIESRTSASRSLSTELYLLADHFIASGANFPATERISAAFVGGGLTAPQVANLSAALGAYLTTLGA